MRILHTCAAIAAIFLFLGCASDSEYGSQATRAKSVKLHFNLTVPADAEFFSRAPVSPPGHVTEGGTAAESAIDILGEDYKIVIFNDADGSFVTQDIEMVSTSRDDTPSASVYTMIGEVSADKLEALDGFRVMVLANLKSFGAPYYPNFEGRSAILDPANASFNTQANIFKNTSNFNFVYPNSGGATTPSWSPTLEAPKSLVPMFGYSEKLVLPDASDATPWGEVIINTEISMLRSIAKIELVDNMSNNEINAATLSLSNRYGRYIPDITVNADWDKEAKQVSAPSLPANVGQLSKLTFHPEKRVIAGEQKTVWFAYVPEMDLSVFDADDNRPYFEFNFGTVDKRTPFDNYDENGKVDTDNHLQTVLRNHIYRYTVSGSLSNLSVDLDVQEWNMVQDEDWHFDIPTVRMIDDFDPEDPQYPYYISWTTEEEDVDNPGQYVENGYFDDSYNLQLIMKPNTEDYAECTFTLAAPLNATWIAQLIPTQGELDAFKLHSDFSSGKIDGTTPAVVKIRNTKETVNNERNEARLVIMVEYPDKTQREVIVVKPGSNGTNYTIVQQKTSIM